MIEEVFRAERARVLASTIRATHGDFELAEEVVQDAFAAALAKWPAEGVPAEPRAWLIGVARNKAVDAIRRRIVHRRITSDPDDRVATIQSTPVEDDRLRLIFTCCHPALAQEAQVALTLRTLCGLTTDEIARAFLTAPATLAQRIVRAKSKIKDAAIPYEVPEASQLPERTDAVMAVVYLVFNEGYSQLRRDLCGEAIRLGRLLVELIGAPETIGLLALMLLHDARFDARTDGGEVVLLEDQDRARWDHAQIAEALPLVPFALRGAIGPYGLQSAIAALHAQPPTDWAQIAALYGELHRRLPSPVVMLNRAVAVAMGGALEEGLAMIEALAIDNYYLRDAARADLLRRLGRVDEAARAYRAALAHEMSAPERRFLEKRLTALGAA